MWIFAAENHTSLDRWMELAAEQAETVEAAFQTATILHMVPIGVGLYRKSSAS